MGNKDQGRKPRLYPVFTFMGGCRGGEFFHGRGPAAGAPFRPEPPRILPENPRRTGLLKTAQFAVPLPDPDVVLTRILVTFIRRLFINPAALRMGSG
jgi:hypothetical protein